MTKKELIKYLRVCFDAEEGLYDCTEMIEMLKGKQRTISMRVHNEILPGAPVCEPLEEDRRDAVRERIKSCKRFLIFDIKRLHFSDLNMWWKEIKRYKKELEKLEGDFPELTARNKKRVSRFEKQQAEYMRRTEAYHVSLKIADRESSAVLEDEQKKYEMQKEAFRESLNTLYGMEILPSRFQNIDAVYHLAEYLEMGVADRLTGMGGAYRVYLEDLRTGAIVASINEMRKDIVRALNTIARKQDKILIELRQVNDSMQELNGLLDTGMSNVCSSIREMNMKLSRSMDANTAALKKHSEKMHTDVGELRNILEGSAYNRYLIDRKENVDSYLHAMLVNPAS